MYLKSRRNQGAGGDRPPQTLADLLTLSQSGGRGVYYAYHITNPPPGFSCLPTTLTYVLTEVIKVVEFKESKRL